MSMSVQKGSAIACASKGSLEILTMDDYARRLEHERPEGRRAAEQDIPEGQPERQLSV
jgi:hypothetical protein